MNTTYASAATGPGRAPALRTRATRPLSVRPTGIARGIATRRIQAIVPPEAEASWLANKASIASQLVFSLRASERFTGPDFGSFSPSQLTSAFVSAMTTDVYPHFPAGHPLFTSTVERVSVSQRTTKAGDVLYVFTLPCSPGLKSDILECLIRHHAGQLHYQFNPPL